MASLFDKEETLCDRFANKCKLRGKCLRHENQNRDGWILTYWQEFGKHCAHFQPLPKAKVSQKKAEELAIGIAAEVRKGRKD